MNYKTLNIKGEIVSMEITRKTTESGLDTLGWSLHAVSNRGLQLHSFISGCDEGQVWIEAKELVRLRLEIIEQKKKSDLLFERIQDLDLEDKKDCFCYFFGAMQDRIEDSDIAQVDKWIEEKKKYRAEELLPDCPLDCDELDDNKQCRLVECKFKDSENVETALLREKKMNEEVDISDCCHSEDVETVQPPLRSSVQSSPDDPYYVCGSCEQKCELITIKRSELEGEN